MRVAELAGIEVGDSARACLAALDPRAPADYRELAALMGDAWHREPPDLVGLAGGQGTGKTTLSRLVDEACRHEGLRCCVLSIDDFYLPKVDRRRLAERVHPLFETRGPPGTHDMGLCAASLDALRGSAPVRLPVFDKGLDDRAGWRQVTGPFDLLVLEGWCVGARPVEEAALEAPINSLEADEDPSGSWRRAVNAALQESYLPVWERLDLLVLLAAPGLEAIRRWRLQQESQIPLDTRRRRMDAAEVDRFVAHYERVTRAMLEERPTRADWLVRLDEAHRISALSIRPRA